MNKIKTHFSKALVALLLCLSFTACKKDEAKPDYKAILSSHKWKFVESKLTISGIPAGEIPTPFFEITEYTADNVVKAYKTIEGKEKAISDGTYAIEGDKLIYKGMDISFGIPGVNIIPDSNNLPFVIKQISDDKLVLKYDKEVEGGLVQVAGQKEKYSIQLYFEKY